MIDSTFFKKSDHLDSTELNIRVLLKIKIYINELMI